MIIWGYGFLKMKRAYHICAYIINRQGKKLLTIIHLVNALTVQRQKPRPQPMYIVDTYLCLCTSIDGAHTSLTNSSLTFDRCPPNAPKAVFPLEIVRDILGHFGIKATEIYAKILADRMENEMQKLKY